MYCVIALSPIPNGDPISFTSTFASKQRESLDAAMMGVTCNAYCICFVF